MASARSTISRPPRKVVAASEPAKTPAPVFGDSTPTEPKMRAVHVPSQQQQDTPPDDPAAIQRRVARGAQGEDRINVRLLITGSDDDGIRAYDEQLPMSLVRALLDPDIADFFIPIAGTARTKPPRTKSHWLHTGAIREILILDDVDLFAEGEDA